MNVELADASRFRDAYYKLLNQTEGLLARNDLAEEEAERLSRFNAEILGHHNPAQRIVYVDRIRRELADTKQVHTVLILRAMFLNVSLSVYSNCLCARANGIRWHRQTMICVTNSSCTSRRWCRWTASHVRCSSGSPDHL